MLSLLTYGATFGVAEAASTRHEFEAPDRRNARKLAIDPTENNAIKPSTPAYSIQDPAEFQTQEQHATKGGAIGWLKRLIWRQT